jgi:hypothetical protein
LDPNDLPNGGRIEGSTLKSSLDPFGEVESGTLHVTAKARRMDLILIEEIRPRSSQYRVGDEDRNSPLYWIMSF